METTPLRNMGAQYRFLLENNEADGTEPHTVTSMRGYMSCCVAVYRPRRATRVVNMNVRNY